MPTYTLEEEINAIIEFLSRRDSRAIKRVDDTAFQIDDPREAWIIASNSWDSFFLRELEYGGARRLDLYPISLEPAFDAKWAFDIYAEYPELCTGKKVLKFFQYWTTMAGYTGSSVEYRTRKAQEKRIGELASWLRSRKLEPADCLFIPYYEYKTGPQLSESIYHYIAGLVFKEMGFLVLNEFAPAIVSGSGRRPDVSAFKTTEIEELLSVLLKRGIISSGAFEQELQMYRVFGKQSFKPRPLTSPQSRPLTEAQSVLVEVKRNESYYLRKKGLEQIQSYLTEAYGFYDEGYLISPLLEKQLQEKGMISIDRSGELLFSRAEQSRAEFLPEWNKRKKTQLDAVTAAALIQLAKNIPLKDLVSLCETGNVETVTTCSSLLSGIQSINVESLVTEVEKSVRV